MFQNLFNKEKVKELPKHIGSNYSYRYSTQGLKIIDEEIENEDLNNLVRNLYLKYIKLIDKIEELEIENEKLINVSEIRINEKLIDSNEIRISFIEEIIEEL